MSDKPLKEMVKIVDNSIPYEQKKAEEKQYLICLNEDETSSTWIIVTGRTEAYQFIKTFLETYLIDFEKSFILVEGCKLEQRKSIYTFMKHIEQFFPEDSFDIDDYVVGDWSESEYQSNNSIDITPDMDVNNASNDMINILNGDVSFVDLN